MKKQIAIIGNGWLGSKLGISFNSDTYKSSVFSRNTEKISTIINYTLGDKIPHLLYNSKIVLFCVPPSFRRLDTKNQLNAHHDFFKQLSNETYLIYTSSTSVYTTNDNVDEGSPCDGPIFEIENMIRSRFNKHLILRLGGLAGPNRTIVNMLQKKGRIDSYDAPTNLLHLSDALQGIKLGVEKEIIGTFNLCSSLHPSKLEVYNSWNRKLNLPELPKGSKATNTKTVDNTLWRVKTGYNYAFPSPLDFIFEY